MEGFCRGCLVKYNDPMELLQYTEKYRRLFIYSTGLQVKRNDTITFQLCKDCFLNMKAACKFKKICRASDKKLKSYLALKDVGDGVDFCTFLKNNDDTMTFRLPLLSGCSTPANHKTRDEDNESTCTSIRNFMTDILQGEEMPDTEARIIREVIEEEADVLDDSLDSHWLQDDASIDTDFRLDFSFSPFATPHSINNDHGYTPKPYTDHNEEQGQPKKYFTSISPARQHKVANDFTDIIKNNHSEKELCTFDADEIDGKGNFDMPITSDGKSINNLDIPSVNSDKLIHSLDLPMIDNDKSINNLDIPSIDSEKLVDNLDISIYDNEKAMKSMDIYDNEKSMNNLDLPSIPSIDNDRSISSFDLPLIDNEEKNQGLNIKNFYISNKSTDYNTTSKEIERLVDGKVIQRMNKDKQCVIDQNLEKALKDENNKEFSLDDLLDTPQVCPDTSAASTPTIANILFGEKLELHDNKNKHEIIEEFLQSNSEEKVEILAIKKDHFKVPMNIDEVDTGIDKKTTIKNITSIYNEENFDLENFFCNLCNKKFESSKALSIHFIKKHNIKIVKPKSMSAKYKPRICNICGREFRDLQNFHRHLKRHEKQVSTKLEVYKCERCTLEFSSQSKLDKHKVSHNGITAPKEPGKFICTICGASSTTIGNFRLHQRRHTNNYTYKCELCGKGFYRKSDMTVHERLHTGEKPFPCKYCDKSFARKDALTKHVKCHIDDRPFQCEHCNVRFTNSSQLKVHLRLSVKCRRLRGILDDKEESQTDEMDAKDTVKDTVSEAIVENNVKVIEIKSQLPYIDTEMSN